MTSQWNNEYDITIHLVDPAVVGALVDLDVLVDPITSGRADHEASVLRRASRLVRRARGARRESAVLEHVAEDFDVTC